MALLTAGQVQGQPDQEPASEPSASGPRLEKPEPDSTVFVMEDIEEALAEVLVQEAPAGSTGSQASLESRWP